MKNRTAVAVRVVFGLALFAAALAARATTIDPLPGSTPQSTRQFAFFPVDVGVIVRDDAGNPMAGEAVRFDIPFSSGQGYAFFPNSSGLAFATTDANGVAVPEPNLVGSSVGPITMMATLVSSSAVSTTFDLAVQPGPPRTLSVVSGSFQRARIGTTYRLPWVVQALGDDGLPVPYTLIQFYARPDNVTPSGLFEGENTLWSKADANGVATSPPFTANDIVGGYFGSAAGESDLNSPMPWAFFYFTNLAVDDVATVSSDAPRSVAVGGRAFQPFAARVTNLGAPVPGLNYRFVVDPACGVFSGSFGGPTSPVGVTDINGVAESPPFVGVAPSLSCRVTLTIDSVPPAAFDFSMHVFSYAAVVMTPQPPSVASTSGQPFRITLFFTADGLPIVAQAVAGMTFQVNPNKNGASATMIGGDASAIENWLYVDFGANDKQGDYTISFSNRNGARGVTVPVSQRKR